MTDETFTMQPHYDILLRGTDELPIGLYQLHQANAEQLCRLHYSAGSVKAVKLKLKALAEHGFVQRSRVPPYAVSSPYYYSLGQEGMNYLETLGYDVNEAWRGSNEIKTSWLFLDHALELNDVVISAALISRANPDYALDFDTFLTDRWLKRQPYQASWVSDQGRQTFTVIPDARLDFRRDKQRLPVLLEHDRGTEEQQHFRRRIRAYIMLIKTGSYQELFGTKTVTVAFTTFKGQQRLEKMLAWTKAELAGEPPYMRQAFCFANLAQPITPGIWLQDAWQTPDDNSLALLAA